MAQGFSPEEMNQLAERTTRSFGGKQMGNAQRAKEALQNYPDFANRLAVQQGMRTATPNNSDRDDSMREFRVDDAVYKSLQNADGSMPDEAKPAPAASSGKKARSSGAQTATGPKRDTAPSEGGREARATAEADALSKNDGGFHRTGKTAQSVPDGGADVGMGNGAKAAIGVAAGAGAAWLARQWANRGKSPNSVAAVEPGTAVATRPPVLEGTIEPDAAAPRSNIDTAIESSLADEALPPPQRQLPAPAPAANTDVPVAAEEAPSGPRQLKGPSRASQYPTPMQGEGELSSLTEVLQALRGQPDASGVERTLGRVARPKVRAPGR